MSGIKRVIKVTSWSLVAKNQRIWPNHSVTSWDSCYVTGLVFSGKSKPETHRFSHKQVGAKTSRLVRGSLRQLDAGHLRPKIQLAVLLMLEHEAAAFFGGWVKTYCYHMAVCQNLVPLVNIKIAGKWMFIPLKMVLIGIDPYPYLGEYKTL